RPEYIAVEVGGYALGVVVRGHQFALVLHQVDTEQERVARLEKTANMAEEGSPLRVVEVAYRAAEKDNQLASVARDAVKMRGKVADHGVDTDARKVCGSPTCGLLELRLADVEWHIEGQAAADCGIDEHAGLARRSGAELNQRLWRHRCNHLGGHAPEDLGLCAGQVILWQLGDGLKELRSPLVVEPA